MNAEQQSAIELFAAGALGWVHQWAMMAPKKVPTWAAWAALGVASAGLYWWATPNLVDQVQENWRIALFELVGFFLMAKGTGSAASAAKVAPKTDSL